MHRTITAFTPHMAIAFPFWTKRGVYQNKPHQFTARVHHNELLVVWIKNDQEYFLGNRTNSK